MRLSALPAPRAKLHPLSLAGAVVVSLCLWVALVWYADVLIWWAAWVVVVLCAVMGWLP